VIPQPLRLGAFVAGILAIGGLSACGTTTSSSGGGGSTATSAGNDDTNGSVSAPPVKSAYAINAKEFSFEPSSIELKVNQPVTLTITNSGTVDHDLKSELPITHLVYTKAANPADEQQENISQNVLDVDYDKGTVAIVTFTPTKPGTFSFHCDIAGHTEAGMTGNFVVVS
jgi:uncharacterized cupredoxin-like copper-binding protein